MDIQNGVKGWPAKLVADINSVVAQVAQVLGKWCKKEYGGLNFVVLRGWGVGHVKRRDKDDVSHIISVRSGLIRSRSVVRRRIDVHTRCGCYSSSNR